MNNSLSVNEAESERTVEPCLCSASWLTGIWTLTVKSADEVKGTLLQKLCLLSVKQHGIKIDSIKWNFNYTCKMKHFKYIENTAMS